MVHGQDFFFPLGSCSLANLPIAEGSKSLPGVSKIGDDSTLTWKNRGDTFMGVGSYQPFNTNYILLRKINL
jgi:hypothetical protein